MQDSVKKFCSQKGVRATGTGTGVKVVQLTADNDNTGMSPTVVLTFLDPSPDAYDVEAEIISSLLTLQASNDG